MDAIRDFLESRQTAIYLVALLAGALTAWASPAADALQGVITPALAVMLYLTFLQLPVATLGRAFAQRRFMLALFVANFLVIPLWVAVIVFSVPAEPLLRLGMLLVLLSPCIDYVVVFARLGCADAESLLAATPLLLLVQMLLPADLRLLSGQAGVARIGAAPFLHALWWLIAVPLVLAWLTQRWVPRTVAGRRAMAGFGVLPVPGTATVLFVVVAAVSRRLAPARAEVLRAVPVYIAFAIVAPLIGWWVARGLCLGPAARRAVAFSAATRNSLVILPIGLAVPGAMPVVPAVIVTQTLVELLSELAYVRVFAGHAARAVPPGADA